MARSVLPSSQPRNSVRRTLLLFAAAAALSAYALAPTAAQAQFDGGAAAFGNRQTDPNAQMLVQAQEIHYDYSNERVSAVGRVQIHYSGSVLEADKVVYDQRTKRLRAEGNVRLTEADGKVIYGTVVELDDQFRDGFVDSLRIEAPDNTRFAATRADRSDGRYTVFQSGVYTACEPCRDKPQRPPMWQVKTGRIIHDQQEKMLYFEDARLEFLGVPTGYLPFFSAPDPTVKKKSGILTPKFYSSNRVGTGIEIPYFWNIAPDYDVTISPRYLSGQGVLMQGEWRQRLISGSYGIRAAGIFQSDKDFFLEKEGPTSPGYRDLRGTVQTSGLFNLAPNWVWGWDATVVSDRNFLLDYGLLFGRAEAYSQVFLSGRGTSSYFDARVIHILGLSGVDVQKQLPIIRPLLDYDYVFNKPIFGGELGYRLNVTGISREQADFDPINQTAYNLALCDQISALTRTRDNCLLRGFAGEYTRLSAEAYWRRTIIDPFGQVFTPFVQLRADAAALSVKNEPGVSNFLAPGDSGLGRIMPTAGLEYRYPFISVHSWGTQTLEPVAQVIVRPNEQNTGRFPNEDAQSVVFDASTLFRYDKFSGWDRVEGGGRANVGLRYTAQLNRGGYFNTVFGQSYHLFGLNSYAAPDLVNAGVNSGLESRVSDYVGSVTFAPNANYALTSRARFDEQTFDPRRFEIEGRVSFERWTTTLLYGIYDAQPEIGQLNRREGVLGAASFKLTHYWSVSGGARYDVQAAHINSTTVGLSYLDECLGLNLFYTTSYGYTGSAEPASVVMVQINLRTLGGFGFGQAVSGEQSTTGSTLGIAGF